MSVAELAEQMELGNDDAQPKKKRGRPPKHRGLLFAMDLGNGTTFIAFVNHLGQVVVMVDREGLMATPTAIAFEGGDPDKPLFGRTAVNYRKVHPEFSCVMMKRARGHGEVPGIVDKNGRVWTVAELEAMFVQWRLKHAEEVTGENILGVLVTVPADFNDAQRRATMDIVETAGYKAIATIDEPTSAVISYALGKTGVVAVIDIGAGTTDVTILRVEEGNVFTSLSTRGRDDLGGKEYTARLVDFCISYAAQNGVVLNPEEDFRDLVLLENECELAKLDLSSQEAVVISFRAKDRVFDVTLTRSKFEELVAPLNQAIFELVTDALNDAHLQPSEITDVVFAGGGCRVPCARASVEMFFGVEKVKHDIDVDKAVITGAALAIGLKVQECVAAGDTALAGQVPEYQLHGDIRLREILGQALGVKALDLRSRKDVLAAVLAQGTPIPACETRTFGLMNGNRANVDAEIVVLQGNDNDPPDQAQVLAQFPLSNLPAGPTENRIQVSFSVEYNGLIDVKAVDTFSGAAISGQADGRNAVAEQSLA